MILLSGWVLWWVLNPELGSPADKDLAAPVFLSLPILVPAALIFGIIAAIGANGRPRLERISYIVFAAITLLVGNAFAYAPDDLFYCDVSGHSSCAASVSERLLSLATMEVAAGLQLGAALLIVALIRRMSRSGPDEAAR